MNLSDLNTEVQKLRSQAGGAQEELNRQVTAVRADQNLSEEGKKKRIAELQEHTQKHMKGLREQERDLVRQTRDSLERRVIGTVGYDPSSVISYRDAQERADRIQDREEAARLMNRALASQDRVLASAVALKALDGQYSDVYEQYAAANPVTAVAARELAELDGWDGNPDNTLQRALTYGVFRG